MTGEPVFVIWFWLLDNGQYPVLCAVGAVSCHVQKSARKFDLLLGRLVLLLLLIWRWHFPLWYRYPQLVLDTRGFPFGLDSMVWGVNFWPSDFGGLHLQLLLVLWPSLSLTGVLLCVSSRYLAPWWVTASHLGVHDLLPSLSLTDFLGDMSNFIGEWVVLKITSLGGVQGLGPGSSVRSAKVFSSLVSSSIVVVILSAFASVTSISTSLTSISTSLESWYTSIPEQAPFSCPCSLSLVVSSFSSLAVSSWLKWIWQGLSQ